MVIVCQKKFVKITRYLFVFLFVLSNVFGGWSFRESAIQEAFALNKAVNNSFETADPGTNWISNGSQIATLVTFGRITTTTAPHGTYVFYSRFTSAGNNRTFDRYITQNFTPSVNLRANLRARYKLDGRGTPDVFGLNMKLLQGATTVTNVISYANPANTPVNGTWQTSAWSSNINLTAGVTYTIEIRWNGTLDAGDEQNAAVDFIEFITSPSGLTGSLSADNTTVSLSWTNSTPAIGAAALNATTPYKVYRSTQSPPTNPSTSFLSNATTASFVDSNVYPNTTFYYAVADVDTNNNISLPSIEFAVTTKPGAPTDLNFTSVTGNSLTLNWAEPVGGADSYTVERCTDAGCSNYAVIASGLTDLYYVDSVSANTTYQYRVLANGAGGDSQYSEVVSVTTELNAVVSVSISSSGVVVYGVLPPGGSKSTTETASTQTTLNDGNVVENFNIRGQNTACPWTLAPAAGTDQYVHEFSIDGGNVWNQLTTNYQQLATGVAVNGTQNFDLKITVPNVTNCYDQQSADVTIQAVQP